MKRMVRAVRIGGKTYRKKADGSLVPLRDRTDWSRVNTTAVATEPGSRPFRDEEWAKVKLVDPFKEPVTIRLDRDVVRWFKARGRGYQTRINAVLRRFVEAQRKTG